MAIAAIKGKQQNAASLLDILSPHAHKGLDADGSLLLLGRLMPDQPGPCMPAHSSIAALHRRASQDCCHRGCLHQLQVYRSISKDC